MGNSWWCCHAMSTTEVHRVQPIPAADPAEAAVDSTSRPSTPRHTQVHHGINIASPTKKKKKSLKARYTCKHCGRKFRSEHNAHAHFFCQTPLTR